MNEYQERVMKALYFIDSFQEATALTQATLDLERDDFYKLITRYQNKAEA